MRILRLSGPGIWHDNVKYTYENWKKRRGNYDDYLKELSLIYVESLKGLDRAVMDFVAGQVIELGGDKVYMYTRREIQRHKELGHPVFFISGSPDYLVHKMAERYGITDSIGSRYLLDADGIYTGDVEQMWDSRAKYKAVLDYVKTYDIDLHESYAYGDTSGDLSMFQLVGHPVAVNPTHELLSHLSDKVHANVLKPTTQSKRFSISYHYGYGCFAYSDRSLCVVVALSLLFRTYSAGNSGDRGTLSALRRVLLASPAGAAGGSQPDKTGTRPRADRGPEG